MKITIHTDFEEVAADWGKLAFELGIAHVAEGNLDLNRKLLKHTMDGSYRIPQCSEFYQCDGLHIVKVMEGSNVVGLLPFADYRRSIKRIWGEDSDKDEPYIDPMNSWWVFPHRFLMRPGVMQHMVEHFPDSAIEDTSFIHGDDFYAGMHTFKTPANVIDISNPDYLSTISSSRRRELKKILAANADLTMKVESRPELWDKFIGPYIEYWWKKELPIDARIHGEKIVVDWARETGNLIELVFYLGDEVVAVNYCLRSSDSTVIDYLCLWSLELPDRWLGFYAILRNIEYCRSLGYKWYDLSSGTDTDVNVYKRKFINTDLETQAVAVGSSLDVIRHMDILPPYYLKDSKKWVLPESKP